MTKDEAIAAIIEDSYHVALNMNDVFFWGCAQTCDVDPDDFFDLVELYQKYQGGATLAYASVEDNMEPQNLLDHCPTSKSILTYKDAKVELLELIKQGKFPHLAFEIEQREKEVKEFGSLIEYTSEEYSHLQTWWFHTKKLFKPSTYRIQRIRGTLKSGETFVGGNRHEIQEGLRKLRGHS